MKKRYAVPAVAGLLTIGMAGVAEASPPSTTPTQTSSSDDDNDSGKVGLFGLLGWPAWPGCRAQASQRAGPLRHPGCDLHSNALTPDHLTATVIEAVCAARRLYPPQPSSTAGSRRQSRRA